MANLQQTQDINELNRRLGSLHARIKIVEQAGLVPTKFRDLEKVSYQEVTYDPPNLAAGAQTSTTITLTNASFGDWSLVSAPYSLQGITVNSYVSAANTVTINLYNGTSAAIDLASGVWRILLIRRFY